LVVRPPILRLRLLQANSLYSVSALPRSRGALLVVFLFPLLSFFPQLSNLHSICGTPPPVGRFNFFFLNFIRFSLVPPSRLFLFPVSVQGVSSFFVFLPFPGHPSPPYHRGLEYSLFVFPLLAACRRRTSWPPPRHFRFFPPSAVDRLPFLPASCLLFSFFLDVFFSLLFPPPPPKPNVCHHLFFPEKVCLVSLIHTFPSPPVVSFSE